jgi:hypothetical protein
MTTTMSNVIVNAAGSSTVAKINSVVIANTGSATITSNVEINRSNTGYAIASNISIPGYSTMVISGKDTAIYLEEGDVLRANVSANAAVLTSSYEIIS